MSFLKRQFCKNTISFGSEEETFDDNQKVIIATCSHCRNEVKIEYAVIRAIAGKLLGRAKRKKVVEEIGGK